MAAPVPDFATGAGKPSAAAVAAAATEASTPCTRLTHTMVRAGRSLRMMPALQPLPGGVAANLRRRRCGMGRQLSVEFAPECL
jgi:hypothetical protein